MEKEKFSNQGYKEKLRRKTLEQIGGVFRDKGVHAASKYVLEMLNTEVRYQENPVGENRRKLNGRKGLIISNHPGLVDTPAILGALTRNIESIKAVVSERIYERYSKIFGKNNFISAPSGHGLKEARELVNAINDHINYNNGVVLLYPSGEMDTKDSVNFKSGFRVVLDLLSDDTMVYCFNFREEEIRKIAGPISRMGLNSEAIGFPININKLRDQFVLNVGEHYTEAGEWKAISANDRISANKNLSEHYKGLFPSSF